jgi:hypothetical protein
MLTPKITVIIAGKKIKYNSFMSFHPANGEKLSVYDAKADT